MPAEIAPAVIEARKLALSWALKALQRLGELLDSEDERVVVAAATALLDRAGVKTHAANERVSEPAAPVVVDVEAKLYAPRSPGVRPWACVSGGRPS